MGAPVLLPELEEGDPRAAEFLVDRDPIRQRAPALGEGVRVREQKPLQPGPSPRPSGRGEASWAPSARDRYSPTVVRPRPRLRAIWRSLSPANRSRSTSRILRMDNQLAGTVRPPQGERRTQRSRVSPRRHPPGSRVTGFPRNVGRLASERWPASLGISGAGIARNIHLPPTSRVG